ncbi:MAG: PQQ-like beta-propeller repeat protein [Prevotellaceae bacterium]|jgi:outer membrane protein assembly factor BamB|nr:PQQ-like beta-propeller repeat protein [Prevotellaceae bacterium]
MLSTQISTLKNRILFLPLLLLWGCSDNSVGEAEQHSWPQFRGDAAMTGYTSVNLPKNPTLLWSYKSGARTSSSPVVYNQTAYWCDKRGKVYGVDIAGKLAFTCDFQTAVEATPAIYDSVLYAGRIDGFMSAISLATGDTIWNFETMGQISAAPAIGDIEGRQAVIFGSYDSYLYCVDRQSGKLIRRFESGYYLNGAVALWEGYFVFGGCDAWLRIISSEAGAPSDSLKLDTYIPASPAIEGGCCYIADHSGNVYEVAIEKGKIIRSRKIAEATSESATFVSVPAVSKKTLFVLSDDRHLYAISREDGSIRWKYLQKGASGESSPVVCRDKIIICSKSGVVSMLSAASGELLWEYDTGETITASPAVIAGAFFILTAKGTLLCFGEKGGA